MAAHIGPPAHTRRFVKIYLLTWGLLALGALAYLTALTFPRQEAAPPVAGTAPGIGGGSGDSKSIADGRGSGAEIRREGAEAKAPAGGERVDGEKLVKTRIVAVEDRASTGDGASTPPPSPAPADGSAQAKAEPQETPPPEAPEAAPKEEIDTKAGDDAPGKADDAGKTSTAKADAPGKSRPGSAPPPVIKVGPGVPIETGSIAPKEEAKEDIVFGEPVVTKGGEEFAVQLAAAASLSALKQSWGQLTERHAGALVNLKPRVVAPRAEGGIYRLIAGPLPTKADADRVCSELHVGPRACFATPYVGAPL